ncbi:hypothetical protein AM571_PA00229 (plasmid) [Rhizobium etli 8C-3]|uniref:Uncharacterized protein n=1 Tax=Rhizobium etli 8C-3 TaxID=538025 RepID=A0A1L5PAH8_RHIET|nr:hypothetical protein AM571_PA00229 [Rhizobium etli 8C-3]
MFSLKAALSLHRMITPQPARVVHNLPDCPQRMITTNTILQIDITERVDPFSHRRRASINSESRQSQ